MPSGSNVNIFQTIGRRKSKIIPGYEQKKPRYKILENKAPEGNKQNNHPHNPLKILDLFVLFIFRV